MFFFGLFVTWIFLAAFLAEILVVEKHLERADAILVLSGSAAYIERTQKAATLFREGSAPKIFLTNDGLRGSWSQKDQRNPYFVEYARWELIRQGVPEQSIEILPAVVKGTNDEANLLANVSIERNLKSLMLITSAHHSKRTLWTFKRAVERNNLLINICIKSPSSRQQTFTSFTWWFSMKGWKTVGAEYAKIVYYWLIY